jgi:hypothetical protein
MEFVIVTCDGQSRTVFVDQQDQGMTNQRLSVPEGVHVFDLGVPVDYAPPFQELDIQNTGPGNPLPIAFTPLVARAVRRARKRPRKTVRKRAAARKAPARRAKSRAAKPKRKSAAKRTAGRKRKSTSKKK